MKTYIPLLLAALTLNASAVTYINYNLDHITTGGIPSGPSPWVTIFLQEDSSNSVFLDIRSNLPQDAQFISSIDIPLASFATIVAPVTLTNYLSRGTFQEPTNLFTIGTPDVLHFDFATSNSQNGDLRFGWHDSFSYTINGVGIDDFNINNAPSAHIQSLSDGSSTKITTTTIPEPATAFLGVIGMIGLFLRKRR